MGKATRNRARTARERIAAQQAAAMKAERQRRLLIVGGSIGLVIIIVVGFIVIKGLSKPTHQLPPGQLPASVAKQVTSVPAGTLSKVGAGGLPTIASGGLPMKAITDTALTGSGKPEMLYIGAEFCPFCAAMRWSMAVALSRFGTFGPFTGIHSSSTDTDPNTATLTFRHQKYTSKYLTFRPVENETVTRTLLQKPTKAEQALWVKYDSTSQGVGYPFIDFGNKVIITGPLYDPGVLKGLTWSQIASQLKDPNSAVAKNVNGAANYVTAAICKMTNNTPSAVCGAASVKSIEGQL
jgi:hypothetical protein